MTAATGEGSTSRVAAGIVLVALAAIGFGFVAFFARTAYANGLTPQGALVWRYGLPALLFCWFLPRAVKNRRQGLEAFGVNVLLGCAMIGFFNGFAKLEAAIVVLIFFMHPLFAIAFAALFARQWPGAREVAAALMILAAAAIILEPSRIAGDPWTIAFTFAPPVAYGLLIVVLATRLGGMEPLGKIAASYSGIAVVAAAIAVANGPDILLPTTTTGWLAAIGLVTVSGIGPQLGLMFGAPLLGPGRTAIVGTLELVVALIAGWTLLGEAVHGREIAGAMLVFAAVALTARPSRRAQRAMPG